MIKIKRKFGMSILLFIVKRKFILSALVAVAAIVIPIGVVFGTQKKLGF